MSSGQRGFSHWVSTANVEQARSVAEKMGYRLMEGEVNGTLTQVILRTGRVGPILTLVHSRSDAGQNVA